MPPPPVSGAAVGYAGDAGADVCVVGVGVALVWVGRGVAEPDAWGEAEDEAEEWGEAEDDAAAWDELDV